MPAPPAEVAAWLRDQTSLVPGRGSFTGTVRSDGFSLLRKRMGKRNMRPRLEGTLEAHGDGTRIAASCALPWWSLFMGRGVSLWAALFGLLWLAWGAALIGVPSDPWAIAGALFLALVWMPVSGVLIAGSLVSQGVAERAASPAALHELVAERWPEAEVPPVPETSTVERAQPPRPQRQLE